MKIHAKQSTEIHTESDNILIKSDNIKIVMYLHPIIYDNSASILGAITKVGQKYHTSVNPNRVINGPLSNFGEELENPIKQEYETFIEDCKLVIKDYGFTIIKQYRSEDSGKSEYVAVYGIEGRPCGTLIFEIRISDHPFDATFPDELKDEIVEYLNIHKVMSGEAAKAGIDFQVEKVTVGSVKNDSWDRALNRLAQVLNRMKKAVIRRFNINNQ